MTRAAFDKIAEGLREATALARSGLPRWPAVANDGAALGYRIIGCACVPEGVCERADCPHRDERERQG